MVPYLRVELTSSVSNLPFNIVPYINAVCYCSHLHYSTVLCSTVPCSPVSSVYFHNVLCTILLLLWHGSYCPVLKTFIYTVLFCCIQSKYLKIINMLLSDLKLYFL